MDTENASLIYIVEDDAAFRASTRLLLETVGYTVEDFASATAFLAIPDRRRASCLLLDFNMKGMNGLELLEFLRSLGDHTPAIMVTANDHYFEARYRKAGVLAILPKPPNPKLMLDWIKKACSRA